MKGIDPIWLTVISTLVAIDNSIGGGNISLTHVFPAEWIPWIVGWCGFLGGILGFVVAALTTIISSKPGLLINPPAQVGKMALMIAVALSGLLLLSGAAMAGDIASPIVPLPPAKAINYTPCQAAVPATATAAATPLSCTGGYIGGGLGGEGSNANIIGNGINGSVFAGGITPTFDAGYQYVSGNWMAGAELDVGYAVGTGAMVNGVGNGFNGFRLSEVFKVGGNLSGLLGTQAPITIPPQLANSVLAPYVHVGTTQWQLKGAWANGISSGAGVLFDISPRLFGDLRYTYTNFSAARSGGLTINDDNSLLVTINYKLN